MNKNWIYEVVISCFDQNIPHAAPFGVKTADFKLVAIEMYETSNTLKCILANQEFVLNAVDDPIVFYHALFNKEKLNFGSAKKVKAPVLMDFSAFIEARLTNTIKREQSIIIEAEVVHIHLRSKAELLNRAKGLVLESLILATRIPHFPKRKFEEGLRENYRVIKKVAPGSKYEEMMQDLLKKWGC